MFNKAIFVAIVLFASIGFGASTCETGCDYVAPTTIEQGLQIHLQGPATSPRAERWITNGASIYAMVPIFRPLYLVAQKLVEICISFRHLMATIK